MEEGDISQLESVPANQVKGKRRSKLKMPLKKIPKRKQTSFTEQINLCQDMGNFDYPDNISALIVSSLHGPGENRSSSYLPPLQSSLEKITSNNASKSADGNSLKSRSCESVDRHRKLAHPPPPLVSIARTPGNKPSTSSITSKNMSPTSGMVGGTDAFNKMFRQPMTVSGSTLLRGDPQSTMSSSTLFSSLPQAESLLKSTASHHLTHGGCQHDKGMWRASSRSLESSYESVQSGEPRHCQMHSKLSEPGGTLKVMRPVVQSDKYNSHNLYDMSDTIKSKLRLKSPAKSYKQLASDMRLPLVQVKPPLLAPISPERKRSPGNKRSLLTQKKNPIEGTSGTASTRGRKPNEKNQQNKENSEGVEKRLAGCKKNQQKWYPTTESAQDEETDEDDVIITGVVNLNDLRRYEQNSYTSPKRVVKLGRRKNSKYYAVDRSDDAIDNFNQNDNYECYYENVQQLNAPNITNPNNRKKPAGKRGGYTRKNTKNLVNANELNAKDTDTRQNTIAPARSDLIKTGSFKCDRKCANSLLKSDVLASHAAGEQPKEQMKLSTAPFPSSSSSDSQKELDDKKRDEHFSTIIDAIKKEDDLIKSSMSKKINSTVMETDAVDWKSWLTVFDKNCYGNTDKTEVVEIGSGTDSGNEDDLILRDLSEFLLLSEDRRHSRKQSEVFENAPFKGFSSSRKNFSENNFNFDGSNINFDSIDSSINFINSIDTDLNSLKIDYERRSTYVEDDGINYEDNKYYSKWQSLYDNYPKYPVQNRYKNRSDNYWKRFMLTERNPTLGDTNQYQYRSIVPDKEKRLEESATKAGCILRSETAERGIAPSYESKFYKKRIYRKKNKLPQDVESSW